ncbi:MAG: UDP-N-acetylmuramoyl-tripeptide--D-alanyl-D-alanine ligase [Planctomycetia bacterium]|nr:UDP-N-acetylmuramoyl-tripeptide--D-alanyl-D-alanine ligase [Planctomycetia bacterium]
MKPWSFQQIRRVTLSRWLARGTREFTGRVSTDSRDVRPGDLFIAITGPNFDGHHFIPEVLEAGAAGILASHPTDAAIGSAVAASVTLLQCDDTIRGLNRLAAAYRRELRAKVIAVGGSNGKTTTKRIIHTLLTTRFSGVASPKSFNNNIGLPLTLLSVEPQHEYVVLEVGTNAPGEVEFLGQVAAPDIVVITGVGLEHLEFLSDIKHVAREEAALARFVATDGILLLTNDSPELLAALRLVHGPRFTIGASGSGADMEATEIHELLTGINFVVNGHAHYHLPLLGRHNVYNAMLAIGVARRMGLTDAEIQSGMQNVKSAPMRLEPLRCGSHFIINDAYNANPTSMAAAIKMLATLPLADDGGERPRRVAILGDMLELGPTAVDLHHQTGSLAAENPIDLLLLVGPLMQHAAEAARLRNSTVFHFMDVASAAAALPGLLHPSDVILLKASRGLRLEKLLPVLGAVESDFAAPR